MGFAPRSRLSHLYSFMLARKSAQRYYVVDSLGGGNGHKLV